MSTIQEASLERGSRVLLIEPEDATRRSLQLMLQGWRLDVRSFGIARAAFADSYARSAHVLLVGHRLEEGNGSDVLQSMKRSGWSGRAILVADTRSLALVEQARQCGFSTVLSKPVGRLDLLNALVK